MPRSLSAPEVVKRVRAAELRPAFPSPIDWRDHWIYFLMLDRFNNPDSPPRHQPYDDPNYYDFQGGTYGGVQAQLGYLKHFGVGAIWLSPVLKNCQYDPGSYHGYGIQNFLEAEPRFASNPANADTELRDLVDAAHALGIYIIFDIVLNHSGDVFAYRDGGSTANFSPNPLPIEWRDENGNPRPDWTDIAAIQNPPDDAVVWPAQLHSNGFFRMQGEAQGDSVIGDFASLKQLKSGNASVCGALISIYQYVIARFDCDGFRIDTLRYLGGNTPQVFGNAIREYALSIGKENFFTFGEVFDPNAEEDIARFIGRNTNEGGDLVGVDAALDYPLFFNLPPVAKGFASPQSLASMYQTRKAVEQNIISSHGDASRFFVTFLDNHDVKQRFYYTDPQNPRRFDDQVTLAVAVLFSLQGIPCLYYGTEQGLHGAGSDPAVREALWGLSDFDPAAEFYADIQAIAEVRANQPALRYGRQYFRPLSGDGQTFGISQDSPGVVAFSRILNDEEVVVVANTNELQPVSLWVLVDATLNPASAEFQILYSNKAASTAPGAVEQFDSGIHAVNVSLIGMEVQILGPVR